VGAAPPTEIHPLTAERWEDLVTLFGPRGAVSGCWCMYFKQTTREFDACRGERNRAAQEAIVRNGDEPGLLAYRGGQPVGWVAVEPRERYGRVLRSPTVKPADDLDGVWAIPCFFVSKAQRGRGLAGELLEAAVGHARAHGAVAVEGYPVEPGPDPSDLELYYGTVSMFTAAGFTELAARSPRRRVVRRILTEP
jgi:GNAT superfamily N-acetyltransferase